MSLVVHLSGNILTSSAFTKPSSKAESACSLAILAFIVHRILVVGVGAGGNTGRIIKVVNDTCHISA